MCEGGGRGGEGGGRAIGRAIDLKMPLENGRADERVSRGQASERAVCVCEAISVEKGERRPPLPAAVVCPPGGRRRRRLAISADVMCVRGLIKFIELWLYLCLNKEVHVTFCPYVKTYVCLSLRRDTPSLNAITTVGASRLFLCFHYRHKVSLADLRSFGFITPPRW